MRPARYVYLLEKAIAAAISAIEKPVFRYREETFSILMLNSWELLLKGRILKENNNKLRSIEVWEKARNKSGLPGKKLKQRRNRAGNAMTIGLSDAIRTVQQYSKDNIDQNVVENIVLLTEIRDNAIHFHNAGMGLRKHVQEVGAAALRNFSYAVKTWFNRDLGAYDFALMPFCFESPGGIIQTVFPDDAKGGVAKLEKLLVASKRDFPFDPRKPFNVGVEIDLHFVRKTSSSAVAVRVTPSDPNAVPVAITEEDARKAYPWTYESLRQQLRKRYSDFKENEKFHKIRKPLETDVRYCYLQQLDAKNQKSARQLFYNPNILGIFDQHYTVVTTAR
jgi:hypothetical protein